MPLLPSELTQPFQDHQERAAARHRLAERDRILETIETLARKPASDWSTSERAVFPDTTNGVADPPHQRVARWASLFADELAEVHYLVAGARPLSDLELQEVLYLAGRLLATVSGLPINQVDDFRFPPGSS
jgi:hypothetical protein